MTRTIEILNPTAMASSGAPSQKLTPLASLEGKRVAIMSNHKIPIEDVFSRLEQRLLSDGKVAEVVRYRIPVSYPLKKEEYDQIAQSADLVIVGLAN